MKLERLKGALTKNKVAIAVLGAVAVGAFAWVNRSDAGTSSKDTTTTTTNTADGQTASATGYDSSESDLYDAIQPQIEALSTLQQWLIDNSKLPVTPTTPVPPTPTPPVVSTQPRLLTPALKAALKSRLDTTQPIPVRAL